MNDLFETLRKIVQGELAGQRFAELATVDQVFPADPGNYEATVVLRDSGLVLKHVPLATPRKGIACVPDPGDLVLVQFVGGDLNRPVVIGSLYNDQHRPPENQEQQVVFHVPIDADASSALRIELNETGPMSVKLTLGSALTLTLMDDDPVVNVDVDGKASLKIERSGAITLQASGDLTLKGDANIAIEAGGELNLKGSVINLN